MSVHRGRASIPSPCATTGTVESITDMAKSGLTINGGFFAFKREIFDYIKAGEELVHEPFQRLIAKGELTAYQHDGFWACMDTFKDKQQPGRPVRQGQRPLGSVARRKRGVRTAC